VVNHRWRKGWIR